MKINRFAAIAALLMAFGCLHDSICRAQDHFLKPDVTYKFAERDSLRLLMDIYYPADGSEMTVNGVNKPTILYVFGGGFKMGHRSSGDVNGWFRLLTDEGFTVVAIDYRLGLKDVTKMGVGQQKTLHKAIDMAVEDLFSATKFILDWPETLDIDPSSIVIAGSSAGAITALQAEWELCNRTELASVLPEDFRYAGVMAFSGAVFSNKGSVKYRYMEPATTLMFHGTSDKIVTYKQIKFFNLAFQGSSKIAREFKSKGYDYNIYRFKGNGHEIAASMEYTFPEQLRWLETNVIGQEGRTIDATVNDPSIPSFFITDLKSLYKPAEEDISFE